MHAAGRRAGLRSSGKGANRTILDCLFRPMGRDKGLSAAAGAAGAGSYPDRMPRIIGGGSAGCG